MAFQLQYIGLNDYNNRLFFKGNLLQMLGEENYTILDQLVFDENGYATNVSVRIVRMELLEAFGPTLIIDLIEQINDYEITFSIKLKG